MKYKIVKSYKKLDNFSDDEQAKIVGWWVENYSSWKAQLSSRHDVILDNRAMYNNKIGEKDDVIDTEDPNAQVPYGFMFVNTAASKIYKAVFPTDDRWFKAEPTAQNDVQYTDRKYKVLKYIFGVIDYIQKIKDWIKQGLIDGVGCHKINWRTETTLVQEPYTEDVTELREYPISVQDPITGSITETMITNEVIIDQKTKYRTKEVTLYDWPEVEIVDITKVFYDNTCKNRDFADIMEEGFITYEAIISNDTFGNLEDVESYASNEYRDDNLASEDSSRESIVDNARTRENIKVWYCYGDCQYQDGEDIKVLKNYEFVIIDESILIKCQPNSDYSGRKHPYIFWDCFPDPLYPCESKGLLDLVTSIQKHLNDFWRITIDRAKSELYGRWKALAGEIDDDTAKSIRSGRGWLIEFESEAAYESLQNMGSPSNFQIPIQIAEMLKNEVMQIIGVTNALTGQFDQSKRTATENAIRQQALEDRMSDILTNLEAPLSQSIKMVDSYCKMYLSDAVPIKLNEDDGYTFEQLTRDEFEKTDFDFKITSISTAVNYLQKEESYTKAIQAMTQFPEVRQQINLGTLFSELLRTYRVPNIDNIYKPEPIIPLRQAQDMSIMFAANAVTDPGLGELLATTPPNQIPQVMAQAFQKFMMMQQQNQMQQQKGGMPNG